MQEIVDIFSLIYKSTEVMNLENMNDLKSYNNIRPSS